MSGDEDRARHLRALQFVEKLSWKDLIPDDPDVRRYLNFKDHVKCADIVGFKPSRSNATQVIVCESKGTGLDEALEQIGNVAAAILDQFSARNRQVHLFLLVYGKNIRTVPAGNSPGPNYVVGEASEHGIRPLFDAGTDDRKKAPASPMPNVKVLDARLTRWGDALSKLPVYFVLDQARST